MTKAPSREPRFDGVLGPAQGIGLPSVRTLSDEYRDVPDPADATREPPPEPGLARRLIDGVRRLTGLGRRK